MSLYSLQLDSIRMHVFSRHNVVNNEMSEWMRERESEIKLKRERISEALLRISNGFGYIATTTDKKRHYTLNLGTARAQTTSHTNPFGVSVVVGNAPAKCFQCEFDGKLTVFQNGNFFSFFVRFFNRSSCHCFWIHPKDNDTCLALLNMSWWRSRTKSFQYFPVSLLLFLHLNICDNLRQKKKRISIISSISRRKSFQRKIYAFPQNENRVHEIKIKKNNHMKTKHKYKIQSVFFDSSWSICFRSKYVCVCVCVSFSVFFRDRDLRVSSGSRQDDFSLENRLMYFNYGIGVVSVVYC